MKSRLIQAGAVVVMAIVVVVAGQIQGKLSALRRGHGLIDPDSIAAQQRPELMLLTVAPGGLRAFAINYLWITSEQLKQEGRFFDAKQRAVLICRLQAHFPEVWRFQAWNMAWNISAATHTPDERWQWVMNGVKLLRDEGIPHNPRAQVLYQELARIFYSKMGGDTDVEHMTYKRRWARLMQELLGSPPLGSTQEVIEDFRAIADAPLDRDSHRLRRAGHVQADQRDILLADEAVRAYAKLLAEIDVKIDGSLLEAYNEFSRDQEVEHYRGRAPRIENQRHGELAELINSPGHADARQRLLAFVRAQRLWNDYRMDPRWMLALMEKYGPIDWRDVLSHGLYWSTYGLHVSDGIDLPDIDSLNTERFVLFCLQAFFYRGRLVLVARPDLPDGAQLLATPDPRWVPAVHREYMTAIEARIRPTGEEFNQNVLRSGHVGFLALAVDGLYALGARSNAEYYLNLARDLYQLEGGIWEASSVREFVELRLAQEDSLTPQAAQGQIGFALARAYANLAVGNTEAHDDGRSYALLVWTFYQYGRPGTDSRPAPERSRLPTFGQMEFNVLRDLLTFPEASFGLPLDFLARGELYRQLDNHRQLALYDSILPAISRQAEILDLDLDAIFPPPEGLQEARERRASELPAGTQPPGRR